MTWITNEAGKRMLRSVAPIYDRSRIAQTVTDAIGVEIDRYMTYCDELMQQIAPETATWMLWAWERQYGITPTSDDFEVRRKRVAEKRSYRRAFTPAVLAQYLTSLCGRGVMIDEHTGDYAFGVRIGEGETAVDYTRLRAAIEKLRQAHLAYELTLDAHRTLHLNPQTEYFISAFPRCGTLQCGEQ